MKKIIPYVLVGLILFPVLWFGWKPIAWTLGSVVALVIIISIIMALASGYKKKGVDEKKDYTRHMPAIGNFILLAAVLGGCGFFMNREYDLRELKVKEVAAIKIAETHAASVEVEKIDTTIVLVQGDSAVIWLPLRYKYWAMTPKSDSVRSSYAVHYETIKGDTATVECPHNIRHTPLPYPLRKIVYYNREKWPITLVGRSE